MPTSPAGSKSTRNRIPLSRRRETVNRSPDIPSTVIKCRDHGGRVKPERMAGIARGSARRAGVGSPLSLARRCTARPRAAVALGLVALACGAVFGLPVINRLHTALSDFEDPSSQTYKAARAIERPLPGADRGGGRPPSPPAGREGRPNGHHRRTALPALQIGAGNVDPRLL